MSNETKTRTLEEIQTEFGRLCMRAGQLQYETAIRQKDLEAINKAIQSLNVEAAKLRDKTQAEAKSVASEAPKLEGLDK